ncbi:MAG: GvpL/GvpF family gas vesicle protein [Actinomycetota bacterium]
MNDEELRAALERAARRVTQDELSAVVQGALDDARVEARSILKQMYLRSMLERAAGDKGAGSHLEPVPTSPPEGSGWYVYCVTEAAAPEPELPGVDPEHHVGAVTHDGLKALVSEVPLSQFGAATLPDNLNDLAWLEDKAQAHQRVQQATVERTPMVPLRFCTIYASRERVGEMLAEHGGRLRAALAEVSDKSEWGVKLLYRPYDVARALAQARPDLRSLVAVEDTEAEGAAYINSRRLERATEEAVVERAHSVARGTHERLAGFAVDASVGGTQDKRLTKDERAMALNAAYFVPDSGREAFFGVVDELAIETRADGFSLELTGPWPPYSFVTIDLTARAG